MPLLRDPTVAISRLQNVIMWGDNLWQKFVICFSICFFTIWISTLATWVTIYTARQEGQGSLTAPFNKAVCGNLKDEIGQVATKTGPAGVSLAFVLVSFSLHARHELGRRHNHDRRLQVAPHCVRQGADTLRFDQGG
jgi:hypothetical protein